MQFLYVFCYQQIPGNLPEKRIDQKNYIILKQYFFNGSMQNEELITNFNPTFRNLNLRDSFRSCVLARWPLVGQDTSSQALQECSLGGLDAWQESGPCLNRL